MEKIKFNYSSEKALNKKHLLNLIQEIYTEKIHLDNRHDLSNLFHMHLDEFLIKFLREKFRLKKIFKRNCEKTVLSIIKYSKEDIRIDNFRRFLGLGDNRLRTDVLDCYLLLLKNIPVSYIKLFDDIEPASSFVINMESCNEIYSQKFGMYFLNCEAFDMLLRASQVFKNDKEVENLGLVNKKDIFYLQRYHAKSQDAFQELIKQSKENYQFELNTLKIAEMFIIANKDYDLKLEETIEIFKRNFIIKNESIVLDSFFEFFVEKFSFKIKLLDYLQISYDILIQIYSDLEAKISKIWDKHLEIKNRGIVFYKEFEMLLLYILKSPDNKWKFNEYFK